MIGWRLPVARELRAHFGKLLIVRRHLHMPSYAASPPSRSTAPRERAKISEYKKAGANITPAHGY